MTCCKITRVAEQYGLAPGTEEHEDLSSYLVARWRGQEDSAGASYRELATMINERLLRVSSINNGRQVTTPQIKSEYAALRSDGDDALEVRSALEAAGIDVEELERSFVSHMAIRRHLLGCLDLDPPDRGTSDDWHESSIDYARDRFRTSIEDVCQALSSEKVPDAQRANVQTPIYLRCPECPTRVTLESAIDQGYVCEDHYDTAES
jgi:hypothetical protein